jgi:CopG family nickel-responsive transcriptional regulator
MKKLIRFGVSLDKELLVKFDRCIRTMGYTNRSKVIADLVRSKLFEKRWEAGEKAIGTISMIYNHHQRELAAKLTHIQHDHFREVLSTQHIHLDRDNCLEVILVKGTPKEIKRMADLLSASRGVKHVQFTISPTGKQIG